MPARAQLVKWGNSHAVRLPKAVIDQAQISEGDELELTVHQGTIEIAKARPKLTLEALVKGITRENLHGETSWGGSAGGEVW